MALIAGAVVYIVIAIVARGVEDDFLLDITIPLSIGFAVGVFLTVFSVRMNYETSVQILQLQKTLDELKKQWSEDEQ